MAEGKMRVAVMQCDRYDIDLLTDKISEGAAFGRP